MSSCPRCGDEISASDWWRSMLTVDGDLIDVCNPCGHELGQGPVDPDEWEADDESVKFDVSFQPAAEVFEGP